MNSRKPLTIATRGSQLALWQADFVMSLLSDRSTPAAKLVLTTTGDRVQDRFLHEIGGKGLFTKELEHALLDGRADLAIHSLKDMPAKIPEPFRLAAVLKRHSPRDLFILSPALAAKTKLPEGALSAKDLSDIGPLRVGTGSLRRSSLLKRYAPEIECVGVRGNVDTRLKKLAAGEWDALILAEASLVRLNLLEGAVARALDPSWFIPCAAQGALAIEMRAGHAETDVVAALDDRESHMLVTIERALLARLGGDCTMPFGCLATLSDKASLGPRGERLLTTNVIILSLDGDAALASLSAPYQAASFSHEAYSDALYKSLVAAGAPRILTALGLSGAPK